MSEYDFHILGLIMSIFEYKIDSIEYKFYIRGDVEGFLGGIGALDSEMDTFYGRYNNMKGSYASLGVCTNGKLYLIHLCKDELKDSCDLDMDIRVNSNNCHKYKFSVFAHDKESTLDGAFPFEGLEYALSMMEGSTIRISVQKRLGRHIVSDLDMLDLKFTTENTTNNKK